MRVGQYVIDKRIGDVGYISAVGEDGMVEVRFMEGVLWMETSLLKIAKVKEEKMANQWFYIQQWKYKRWLREQKEKEEKNDNK